MSESAIRWVIGFDIGGTKIEAALINEIGVMDHKIRVPSPDTRADTIQVLLDIVNELSSRHPIKGVGFGIPGSICDGIMRNAPNSRAINGTEFAKEVAAALDVPSIFENDANCLAVAESSWGIAKGIKDVVGVILGTGIGVGVVTQGRLFNGAHGWAPEPGHIPLDVCGRPCECGLLGCVEAYLSGPSILKRYQDSDPILERSSCEQLFEDESDEHVQAILAETQRLYVRFLGMLVSLYDPSMIVLGGGLSNQPLFMDGIEEMMVKQTFGTNEMPRVKRALLGPESGKFGAASLMFQSLSKAIKD